MLQYKIDIISELAKNGINTTTAKKKRDIWTRYHAQVQERRYKNIPGSIKPFMLCFRNAAKGHNQIYRNRRG